ncbi:MAG: threonine ammonia-lyase [Candidatus Nanopelagicales bacterium]
MTEAPITVADIEAARTLIDGIIRHTPVTRLRPLSELCGGPVYLKCENLQRAGSFKIRGAYTRLSRLSDDEKQRGVVAASAGNHAQGVALAAQMLGLHATVFMPEGATLAKVSATRGYGADVQFHGMTLADSIEAAQAYSKESGKPFIHPYDHRDIVTGQGTIGLEILEQCADLRTVVVCTGGGGLLAGIATAIKGVKPEVKIIGVQATGAAAFPASLAAHHPVRLDRVRTMADGIAVPTPGDIPFAIVDQLVDEIRTVSEDSLSRAMLLLLERAKLVVEPAGAAAVAAILEDPQAFEPPVAAVLSGGNIDPLVLLRVVRHGLAAADRYLSLRLRISDTPGSLANLLALLGSHGANVLDLEHMRTHPQLNVDEVEVGLQLETRGPEHATDVLAILADAGYDVLSY